MAELRIRQGAPAPLLERLIDEDPESRHEAQPLRVLDARALRRSIARELSYLLSTRHSPQPGLERRGRTVIDYGLPDTVSSSAGREADLEGLRQQVLAAVRAFEPRLDQVAVEVVPSPASPRVLAVRISARLVTSRVTEPVSFVYDLEPAGQVAETAGG